MGWQARLRLDYTRDGASTRARVAHVGPLRALKALYPEGPGICHHVLLHPPSGLVGGDQLHVDLALDSGSHAVLTTPGASRFYRSVNAAAALQATQAQVAAGARLEWLPQENLIYDGAQALSQQRFSLAPGAAMLGWDILALGLPGADKPFAHGSMTQSLQVNELWLDRAVIAADDALLLNSPLGLAGHRVLATMWLAWGTAPPGAVLEQALDLARQAGAIPGADPGANAGAATAPAADWQAGVSAVNPQMAVLRWLGGQVQPALRMLMAVRRVWRSQLWGLPTDDLRIWRT